MNSRGENRFQGRFKYKNLIKSDFITILTTRCGALYSLDGYENSTVSVETSIADIVQF